MGVVVRDVANLIPTLLGLLVFLMPVYYETPKSTTFAQITNWNPLYHLVCGPRDLLVRGHLASPVGFYASTAVAVALLLFAARLFVGAQYKLAERA
jgi:lipopolysaccharide transport system permease protein